MGEPKRHHYVPQWYLRRFANQREQVRVYHRGDGAYFTTSVDKAAVQTGFYTIKEASGRESQVVEKVLGDIDGKADKVASDMVTGRFPPRPEDRELFALSIALQFVRTRYRRHGYEAMVDAGQKALTADWTAAAVLARLREVEADCSDEAVAAVMDLMANRDRYRIVPDQTESVLMMLEQAEIIAPILLERSWILGGCQERTFITADHPVVCYRKATEENRDRGLGLLNADEVW